MSAEMPASFRGSPPGIPSEDTFRATSSPDPLRGYFSASGDPLRGYFPGSLTEGSFSRSSARVPRALSREPSPGVLFHATSTPRLPRTLIVSTSIESPTTSPTTKQFSNLFYVELRSSQDRAQRARRNVLARMDGHGGALAWIVSVTLTQAASTSTIVKWARGGGTGSPSIRSPSRWQATALLDPLRGYFSRNFAGDVAEK
jgi:hypothetical protein